MVLIKPAAKLVVLMLIELRAPTLIPNVLITPLLEILAVFVTPSVVVPATPRVPELDVFIKVPVPVVKVFVEILPVLLMLTEVRTLPKSSLPTKRFVI